MTTEIPAVTNGDVAIYVGALIEQIAKLEDELAEKTIEADFYFDDLCTCARALAHIELAMNADEPVCMACLLNAIELELEEAEPGFAWAIGMVVEEMAEAEAEDEDDLDVGVEDESKAEDAPATVCVN